MRNRSACGIPAEPISGRCGSLVALVIALGVLCQPAWPQGCPLETDHRVDLGVAFRAPNDVVIVGDHAFTADQFGLSVFDVSDQANPVMIGSCPLQMAGRALVIRDRLAFVAAGYAGLVVVDLTVLEQPFVIGSVSVEIDIAVGVALSGQLALVADSGYSSSNNGRLHVIDVSDPSHPLGIGGVTSQPSDVAVIGSIAYVAQWNPPWNDGLALLDVSDPQNPVRLENQPDFDVHHSIEIAGTLAFGGDRDGVYVLDVSDPAAPLFLSKIPTQGYVSGTAFVDPYLLIADSEAGLVVADLRLPSQPALISATEVHGEARAVAAADDTIVVAAWFGKEYSQGSNSCAWSSGSLTVMTGASLPIPQVMSAVEMDRSALTITSAGDLGVVHGVWGLEVIDLSPPDDPRVIGSVDLPEPAHCKTPPALAVSGNLVFASSGESGVAIIDLAEPSLPQVLAWTTVPDQVRALGVSDRSLLVGCASGGYALDISVPSSPIMGGSLDPCQSRVNAIATLGSYAFVGCTSAKIFDVSDPYSPVHLTSVSAGGSDLDVGNDHLFGVGGNGFESWDVSNPLEPVRVARLQSGDDAIEVHGAVAWLVNSSRFVAGARITPMDVTVPSRPTRLQHAWSERVPNGFFVLAESSSAWIAQEAFLERLDLGCASCAGLEVTVAEDTLTTGGETTVVSLLVRDLAGSPAAGQSVIGHCSLGVLESFVDLGDGRYDSAFTTGEVAGEAVLSFEVNGMACAAEATVHVQCAAGEPAATTGLEVVAVGTRQVRLQWEAVPLAIGYQVSRSGAVVGDVEGEGSTTFTDHDLSPGTEYCYQVQSWSACSTLSPPAEVCALTIGSRESCPGRIRQVDLGNYGDAVDVAVRDGLAVTVDDHGLTTWDISQGETPVWIATWVHRFDNTNFLGGRVALDEQGFAYAVRTGHTAVFDVRDPRYPRQVWRAERGSAESDLIVENGVMMLVYGGCFELYDVTHPWRPELVCDNCVDGLSGRLRGAMAGNIGCVTGMFELMILDLTDPSEPVLTSSLWLGYVPYVAAVWIVDDLAVLSIPRGGEYDWTLVVDIEDPFNPVAHGPFYGSEGILAPVDAVSNGRTLYATLSYSAQQDLAVYDFADPAAPVPRALLDMEDEPAGLDLAGDRLFAAAEDLGLVVIDVADTLEVVGGTGPPGIATNLSLHGQLGVVANGLGGIVTVDLSVPDEPVVLGSLAVPGSAFDVALTDELAFVAAEDGGLQIVALSDPSQPELLAGIECEWWAYGVAARDGLVVVGESYWSSGALEVVDVSDPRQPEVLATVSYENEQIGGVAIVGDYVLAAAGAGLRVYDLSSPTQPSEVAILEIDSPWGSWNVGEIAVVGNLAYLANRERGASVVDVSDPTAPRLVARFDEHGARRIAVDGTTAAVSWSDRAMLLDTSNPSQPFWIRVGTARRARGVAVDRGLLYVLADPFLEVYDLVCRPPRGDFGWQQSGTLVWFEDRTRFAPSEWMWSFGDGETSEEQHPQHRYHETGWYSVTLVVTNAVASDAVTRSVHVVPYETPGSIRDDASGRVGP